MLTFLMVVVGGAFVLTLLGEILEARIVAKNLLSRIIFENSHSRVWCAYLVHKIVTTHVHNSPRRP